MAKAPFILAKTLREAHDYGREVLELPRGKYRVVTSPSIISSGRGCDLYLLPGWEKRHDRFAVKGALRYTRLNVIVVDEVPDVAAFVVTAVPDTVEPPQSHTDLVARVAPVEEAAEILETPEVAEEVADDASAFVLAEAPPIEVPVAAEPAIDRDTILQALSDDAAAVEEPSDDPAPESAEVAPAAVEQEPEPAPAEKPKRVRRKKCPDCLELFLPEVYEAHVATHTEA